MPLVEDRIDYQSRVLLLQREKQLAGLHREVAALRDRLRIEGRQMASDCLDAALWDIGRALLHLDDLQ